jgi:hypothetical protein
MDARDLDDDEWLTQYGSRLVRRQPTGTPFRHRPRFDDDETDISVLVGRISAEEACLKVARQTPYVGIGVRYTKVGTLRSAGFAVEHTPTTRIPEHASVTHAEWQQLGKPVDETLDGCFDPAIWWGEE